MKKYLQSHAHLDSASLYLLRGSPHVFSSQSHAHLDSAPLYLGVGLRPMESKERLPDYMQA